MMKPLSLSRRRHSFMPSSPPGPLTPATEAPTSPDTITPVVHSPIADTRGSVVSLDAGSRQPTANDSSLLHVPDSSIRSHGRKRLSSLLMFRTKSDSHLSTTAQKHAEQPPTPSMPAETPAIMKTAPTQDDLGASKRKSTLLFPRRPKTPKKAIKHHQKEAESQASTPRVTFDGGDGASMSSTALHPPAYDDASASQLAVPVSRMSESSRSDGSSGDHTIYGQTTTITQTTHTTTTFFKLPRRKKDKGSLFPLPPRSQTSTPGIGNTPNLSSSSGFAERNSFSLTPEAGTPTGSPRRSAQHSPSRSVPGTTPTLGRSDSKLSAHSGHSAHAAQKRGRSSTAGSARRWRRDAAADGPTPPLPASSRTSTSTAGRPSLAGIFNLTRIRQGSEPALRSAAATAPATPMSTESNPLSAAPKSPPIVVPERQEGDTPAKYLARLEEVFSRSALVPILSKTDDDFMKNVLRSYMRRFKFFEEPIDMAVRKLLMQVELPKETQQIDRTLQSFADRYHECNPGIFQSPDEAYFIAFSILILHTDVFNKNNKRKMQKTDYLKNTQSQGVAPEILECFYDNVAYTPFIHLDDDTDFIAEKLITHRRKRGLKSASTTSLRRQGQPVDPYALILEGKLDMLRVAVEEVIDMDDPFTYLGTAKVLNHSEMRKAFFRTGVIQIVSSRSRPDAFSNQATIHNPSEAQVGVVDMKVTKVGVLWRKDPKKRKTRSPWQEWGAILTGSQLYFFRNKDWVKSLMHQHESHVRAGRGKTAVIFKPPIDNFKPDFLISTEKMVALCDAQYKRHKNAFVISRENIYQEVLLADNESELNDWLAKINYLAAFRTSGVRMRGVGTGSSSSEAAPPSRNGTASSQEVAPVPAPVQSNASIELAEQIAQARRQILAKKLEDMADKMVAIDKVLDAELRTARHMTVLTPVQDKTRGDVLTASARLAAKLRWERMNRWRVRCHRDILHVDLDEDLKSLNGSGEPDDQSEEGPSSSSQGREARSRLPFPRFNSKSGSTPQRPTPKDHRLSSSSPNTTAKFLNNVEEMFKTPSRGSSKLQRKGSWELPPLTFDRRGSSATGATGMTNNTSNTATTSDTTGRPLETEQPTVPEERIDPNEESESDSDESGGGDGDGDGEDEEAQEAQDDAVTPSPAVGNSEEKQLKPPSLRLHTADSIRSEDDAAAVSATESEMSSASRPKRHSLQMRLHSSHSVQYHRNRKARESSSTVNTSEDGSSLAPPGEGLSRSPGSFTLHGKKASVVTFGSEWQALSGEEGLRARKATGPSEEGAQPLEEDANTDANTDGAQTPKAVSQTAKEAETPLAEDFVDAREVQSPQERSKAPENSLDGKAVDGTGAESREPTLE